MSLNGNKTASSRSSTPATTLNSGSAARRTSTGVQPGSARTRPATRSAADAARTYLDYTMGDMLHASTSAIDWDLTRRDDVLKHLAMKGFISQEELDGEGAKVSISISLLSMAVLRGAMHLPTGTAVAADALRVIALALSLRDGDTILEEILGHVDVIRQHTEDLVEQDAGSTALTKGLTLVCSCISHLLALLLRFLAYF
ncbi:hypothetical protein C8R45DRAFT_1105057 [Mycena sanguinolenta]|nr:hypothetical protein C8R45DRAFT_1105057 [Mycena sanguinolenta]